MILENILADNMTFSAEGAGQQNFLTAGTYNWTVPTGITSISAVLVGGGGPGLIGGTGNRSSGGGGGGLRYINNLPVTPGETITVVVGAGGTHNGGAAFSTYTSRASQLKRSTNVLVEATGGDNPQGGSPYTGGAGGSGTAFGAGPYGGTVGGGQRRSRWYLFWLKSRIWWRRGRRRRLFW